MIWLFKNWFKKSDDEGSFLSNDLNDYNDELYDAFDKNKNKLFGNFSKEGFDCIFELLIGQANENIFISCKNYDVLFNDSNFILLKFIAERFERTKHEIILITYNGEKDERFINLEKEFSSFKYYPCKITNDEKFNNFIVADNRKYWLEDIIFNRKDLNGPFKACVNFNDIRKGLELIHIVNQILIKYEKTKIN